MRMLKRSILFVLLCMLVFGIKAATVAYQDFEGGGDNWTFTESPGTYTASGDIWATQSSLSAITPSSGSLFWGMQDLDNPNGGCTCDHTLTFDPVNVSAYTGVTVAFDYYKIGFDVGDYIEYEVFEDGVGTGTVTLNANTGAWTTISHSVTAGTNSVYIVITAYQNGGSDYAGVDNFVVSGTLAAVGPEINVQGNSVNIADGDVTPSATDHTDFGSVDVTSGTIVRTFTIENVGTTALTLTDVSPFVTISGANAGDFSITAIPSSSIASSGSTTFQVTFDPSALGVRTATISIASDDTDENPYTFDIQGTGVFPEINFNVTSASVSESGTSYTIEVISSYTGTHTADIVILAGGSATNGSEYSITVPVTATFAGSTTFSTTVTINDNGSCDGNADVWFGLNNEVNATIGTSDSLNLLILDDEQVTYTFTSMQFEGCNTSTYSTNGVPYNGAMVQTNGIYLAGGENFQTASIDVSAFTNVSFSIDYSSSGIDSGEDVVLELYYDGSGTPDFTTNLINNGADVGTLTTFTTSVPNGTTSVVARVVNQANGSSDNAYVDNIIMTGEYCACTPPSSSATISNETSTGTTISFDLDAPSGVERLVVVREGSAVTCDPVNTVSYTGNTIYGSGSEIGSNNFVVHSGTNTSITVTNLTSETDYYISVYDYDPGANCYNLTASTTTISTVCPSPLNDVTGQTTSNCENQATTVSWTLPSNCYDEILVVANEANGIGFSPSGDGTAYTANSVYAAADQVVYQGTGTSVTVTGLSNGSTYYYEIFVRKGTSWSNGVEVSCTPVLGYCDPAPSSVDNSGITNVTMGTINNTTSTETNNYGDYSAMSTTVVQGETVSLDITLSTGFTYNTRVWVDWNNDGDFDDLGEMVVDTVSESTNPTVLSVTFDVPLTASAETHRIRIGGADISIPDPCYTGSYASFEDYSLDVILACTPTHSFVSFAPTTGPEETLITIIGTGFTGSTSVTIDGKVAATTFVSSDTITAEVPVGGTTGKIAVTESACAITSASDYTMTAETTPCTAPSSFNDLIISEVYDSDAGNTWYMELYNPTASPIDLDAVGSDYTIQNYSDGADLTPNITFDLTGVVPPGGVFLLDLGTDESDCPSLSFDFSDDQSGINENDVVHLLKNGVVVDEVIAPNQTGYSILRNGSATGPTATYSASDWTLITTEECPDLGIPPVSTIASPTILPNPDDITGSIATFDITATDGNGGTLTYQWKYNDGISAGWSDVTDAAFAPATVDGEQTDSLSIYGGNVADYDGYQFYCEVIEDGSCLVRSYAAQFYTTAPLPTNDIRLRGKVIAKGNLLEWESDLSNETTKFILERSKDGNKYTSLKSVLNSGILEDREATELSYYRVQCVNKNTHTTRYSNIVVLQQEGTNSVDVAVFPNPSYGTVKVVISGNAVLENYLLSVYDDTGRLIRKESMVTGEYELRMASGIYVLQIQGAQFLKTQKLVVH